MPMAERVPCDVRRVKFLIVWKALGVVHRRGVADDSRQVMPGDVFLAYPGDLADGRRYIDNAIERGAVADSFGKPGDVILPGIRR